jgi:hypothetical protein
VTVSEWTTRPLSTAACTAVGHARSLTVSLPEPLRGRRLVDGSSGRAMPVVDAVLRQPSYLPAGYRYPSEEVDNGASRREWTRQGTPPRRSRSGRRAPVSRCWWRLPR